MPLQQNICDFLQSKGEIPVFDVRSPAEYLHGHIPNALSLPLFSDEERHQVGLTYKQIGREAATKLGLDFVGPKLRTFVEFAEAHSDQRKAGLYCWRGGMRSASMSWLLETCGFSVTTLRRGYKAWRSFALQQFREKHKLIILGGNTGAAKTKILRELKSQGEIVIDLEKLAGHKGSAFGWLGEDHQPTQEHFENMLAHELSTHQNANRIWMEDESQRIGKVNLPNELWPQLLAAPLIYLDIPLEQRALNLVQDYGDFSNEELCDAINRIRQKLGGERTKEALDALESGDKKKVAEICLIYYDKYYRRGLELREPGSIHELHSATRDILTNTRNVLELSSSESLKH